MPSERSPGRNSGGIAWPGRCIAKSSIAQYTPAITSQRFAASIGRTCGVVNGLDEDDEPDERDERDERPECEPELEERRRRRRCGSGMRNSTTADRRQPDTGVELRAR